MNRSSEQTDAESFVQTIGLTKTFGEFTALDHCDLSIERGEIFGLLGPNGAGKTTLIRLLMGFLNPTSGSAMINGRDCYRNRVSVHRDVSYLPGDARLFRLMRGKGVLEFFSQVREDADLDRAIQLAERLDLDLNRWVGLMSTGMRQKLAIAIALSNQSPLLILDEPTANLDPTVRGDVLRLVEEAKSQGRTVIFSSHVLSEIEDVCDKVGILRAGKLVYLKSLDRLRRRHRIDARLNGEMPEVPADLASELTIRQVGQNRIRIDTPGELSTVLGWLAHAPLQDVNVQPIGLRAIYDRFHSSAQLISAATSDTDAPSPHADPK